MTTQDPSAIYLPPSTSHPSCASVRDQAALLALGMLDADETARVYDHLLLCPACDAAVQRLTDLTSLIGLATDQLDPSPSVRTTLLTRVAQDAYGTSRSTLHAPRSTAASVLETRNSKLEPSSLRRWPPLLAANRWFAPVAIVVALVVGSVGIQSAMSSRETVEDLRRANRSISAHALAVSLSEGRLKFGDDALLYRLVAGETDAGGVLLGDPTEPRASLSVWNLAGQPGDYTVTVESTDGTRSAAGALTVDARGVGSIDLALFQPIASYTVVHVAPATSPEADVFTLRLDSTGSLSASLED